jgi:hypothetical protein
VPASGVSPSGLTDATEITYPAVSVANSYSIIYLRPGTSGNTQYVFSAYLKGTVGGETIYLMSTANGINWASQSFTLTTDWERCVFPHTTLGTNSYFQIGVDLRDGAQSGQPAQVISVWGAQVEEGSFPTSYIPTTGTTVTRAADLASIEGTNFSSWYNQSEGTVFVDRTFNINNGQTYYFTDSVLVLNRVRLEGINHYGNNSSDGSSFNTAAASNKTALGLQTDNVSVNGGTPDTSFTMPSSLDRLFIGRHPTVSSYLNGHIARLAYYPYRLADATLQEITS